MDFLTLPLQPILVFLVVLARVGGMVTFSPFWGHQSVNARVRAFLAMAVALVLTPAVSSRLPLLPDEPLRLSLILGSELVVGFLIGFCGKLVFSALDAAASALGFQMGLSLASTIDPATQAQTAALGILAQMFGLMVMLAADGHHWVLEVTVRSYSLVGAGGFRVTPAMADAVLRLSADALAAGVALAAPAIIVLLSVEILLAVAGRVAQRLEILLLSFPIKLAAGLWLLGSSIYFMPAAVRTSFSNLQATVMKVLGAM